MVILVSFLTVDGCTATKNHRDSTPVSRSAGATTLPYDYDRHIGWIHGQCLAIKRAGIDPGISLQIISLSLPQDISRATIIGTAGPESQCLALLSERAKINQKKGRSFYTIDLGKADNSAGNFMAVGLLDYAGELVREADAVRIDINGDGKQETARVCQTNEGVKFSLVPVDPRDPTPIWQDYYYLGYDTKPTCKD